MRLQWHTIVMVEGLREYLAAVRAKFEIEGAGEHAYRGALETLLQTAGKPKVQALNDPKRIACGAPDFVVRRARAAVGLC